MTTKYITKTNIWKIESKVKLLTEPTVFVELGT